MAITLWNLFEASILVLNAVCVLNNERFLAKYSWGVDSQNVQTYGDPGPLKSQILKLFWSVRTVAKVPLIFFNVIVIIIKLILG